MIAFFVLGFVFHAWGWAWIVFLLPGVASIWFGDDTSRRSGRGSSGAARRRSVGPRSTEGSGGLPPGHEGAEPGDLPPPPQRYEG